MMKILKTTGLPKNEDKLKKQKDFTTTKSVNNATFQKSYVMLFILKLPTFVLVFHFFNSC